MFDDNGITEPSEDERTPEGGVVDSGWVNLSEQARDYGNSNAVGDISMGKTIATEQGTELTTLGEEKELKIEAALLRDEENGTWATIKSSAMMNNYAVQWADMFMSTSAKLSAGILTPDSYMTDKQRNYPVYEDERFETDPFYMQYSGLFSGVHDAEQKEEAFAYVDTLREHAQRVEDSSNLVLDLATGSITPDMLISFGGGILAKGTQLTAKVLAKSLGYGAINGLMGFSIDAVASGQISPEMSNEDIALGALASVVVGAGFNLTGVGTKGVYRKLTTDSNQRMSFENTTHANVFGMHNTDKVMNAKEIKKMYMENPEARADYEASIVDKESLKAGEVIKTIWSRKGVPKVMVGRMVDGSWKKLRKYRPDFRGKKVEAKHRRGYQTDVEKMAGRDADGKVVRNELIPEGVTQSIPSKWAIDEAKGVEGVGEQAQALAKAELGLDGDHISDYVVYRNKVEQMITDASDAPDGYMVNVQWIDGSPRFKTDAPFIKTTTSIKRLNDQIYVTSNDKSIDGAIWDVDSGGNSGSQLFWGNTLLSEDSWRKIGEGAVTVADRASTLLGGSFVWRGLTSKSDVVRRTTSMIFEHNYITKENMEGLTTTGVSVDSMVTNDTMRSNAIVRDFTHDYYKVVDDMVSKQEGLYTGANRSTEDFVGNVVDKVGGKANSGLGGSTDGRPVVSRRDLESFTLSQFDNALYRYHVGDTSWKAATPPQFRSVIKSASDAIHKEQAMYAEGMRRLGYEIPDIEGDKRYMQKKWDTNMLKHDEAARDGLTTQMAKNIRTDAQERLPDMKQAAVAAKDVYDAGVKDRFKNEDRYKKRRSDMESAADEYKRFEKLASVDGTDAEKAARQIVDYLAKGKPAEEFKIEDLGSKAGSDGVGRASSTRENVIVGNHASYVPWLKNSAIASFKGYVSSDGAQMRLNQSVRGQGFKSADDLMKHLDKERDAVIEASLADRKLKNGGKDILPQDRSDLVNRIEKEYRDYTKEIGDQIAHILNRYKDSEGKLNEVARSASALNSASTLNQVPLSQAMDIFNTMKNHGFLRSSKVALQGLQRRFRAISGDEMARVDPDGHLLDTVILNADEMQNYQMELMLGKENGSINTEDSNNAFTQWAVNTGKWGSRASGTNAINEFTRMLSGRITINTIMQMANKVGKGGDLSKAELIQMKKLGIDNEVLIRFHDQWVGSGSKRNKTYFSKDGTYIANVGEWNGAVAEQFAMVTRKAINYDVFAIDKGVQGKIHSHSNWQAFVGAFTSFYNHANHKILSQTLLDMSMGNWGQVTTSAMMLASGGFAVDLLKSSARESDIYAGEHTFKFDGKRGTRDLVAGIVSESSVLGGLGILMDVANKVLDANERQRPLDLSTDVVSKALGIGTGKVLSAVNKLPELSGGSTYTRARAARSLVGLLPYQSMIWAKPAQSYLIDKYAEWTD